MRHGFPLAAVLTLGASCATAPNRGPDPAAPLPPATIDAPTPISQASVPISVCVFADGELREIQADFRESTGDTVVGGRAFSEAYPASSPPYVASADWYIRNEPVRVGSGRYSLKMKYGLPRVLAPGELKRYGEYRGVPMFVESLNDGIPDVVYFLVRPGCIFQPYQAEYTLGSVRG